MRHLHTRQRGSVLLSIIIVLPFLALIVAAYMMLTTSNFRLAKKDSLHTHAQLATDAGLDVAVDEINNSAGWAGTSGQVTLHDDGKTKTTYEVTVAASGANKLVTAIGRSFTPTTSSTASSTVKVEATLRPVTSGEYSVVSGVGGLVMSNSAKILGGDVFINGKVTMSNSAQIGLTSSAVNLNVAHQSCPNPANATYPRICNSGENGQPITLQNTAHIYGTVKANNQTSGTGMSNPGLTASSGVAAEGLPGYDRDAQKAAVATTQTAAAAGCSSGTKNWPANLKITGDVTISNTCKVTALGNVWITGSLEIRNSAELIVSNALGATRPVIMVDGTSASFKNSAVLRSNSSNTGFEIIAYKSDASCSPDCADVTGSDLYGSQGDVRIDLDNAASGPQTIFYARWTKVQVRNSGQIGALIGQTVELSNSGTITFGTSTGTGTSYWVVSGYRRIY